MKALVVLVVLSMWFLDEWATPTAVMTGFLVALIEDRRAACG